MSTPPVRIGLVGYGKGGRLFHAPLIGHAEGCVLGGVVVRSPQRRAALAADLPHVPVAGSLAELADAGVDAGVVTTPLDSHVELVREAIGLGLPGVCGKPFARDAPAARGTRPAPRRARGCGSSATSRSPATRRRRGRPCSPPSGPGSC